MKNLTKKFTFCGVKAEKYSCYKFLLVVLPFLIINFHFTAVYSQPTLEWARLHPENSSFFASSTAMTLDNNGNIYITGISDSGGVSSRFCVVKYNTLGVQQWVAYFTGLLGITNSKSIAIDNFSNVYVTGYSNNGSTFFDFCTVKFNSNGVLQWFRYHNSVPGGEDEAEKIAVDNAGNVYVSGYADGPNGFVYTTIKYSPAGDQIWLRSSILSGSGNTHVTGIKIDDSCNVYITGECEIKAVTIKYDSSGAQLWAQDYRAFEGFGGTTGAKDLQLDSNNNVYISGYANQSRSFTIKYFASGLLAWERKYNPDTATNGIYNSNSVCVDAEGNVYSSGFCKEIVTATRKLFLIKYSQTGDTLLVKKDTTRLATQQTYMDINDDYIYVTAATSEPGPNSAITTIGYNNLIAEQWRQKYFTIGVIVPTVLKVIDNDIIIAGDSNIKMLTLKYSKPLSIISLYNETPKKYMLEQNFPNPFNPITNINFKIPQTAYVKLIIYDILGAESITLLSRKLNSGSYEVTWDASHLPSGVYLYKLITDTYSETKKMVLIK